MSDNDDLVVVTKLKVEDDVDPGINSAHRKLNRIEREGQRVGASLTRALGGGFAILGGGALFGQAARGVLAMNGELEQANAGMATLLSGIAQMPIADAIGVARNQVKGLRQDAAEGVGELSDYMRAFQMLLGPGLTGGASLDQLRTLTRTSLAAGFAQRGTPGLEQAPMDIVQALTSGVNDRQTPIALSALQAINVEASKFNRMGMVEKIDTLTRAFGAFDEGVALMGQTWDAQTATLRDGVRGLLQQMSEPLFERWSEHLRDANAWLEQNQDRLEDIVTVWGQRMVAVWDHLISQASTYAAIVAGAAVAPAGSALVSAGRSGMAAAGPSLGAALRDPFGMERMFAKGLGQDTTGLTKGLLPTIGTGLLTIGSAIGQLVGPVVVATTVLMAMYGALTAYPETVEWVRASWLSLMMSLGQLGEAFGLLTGESSMLSLAGMLLLGGLSSLIYSASFAAKAIALVVTAMATLGRVMGGFIEGAWNAFQGKDDPFANMGTAFREGYEHFEKIATTLNPKDQGPGKRLSTAPKKMPVTRHITNINGPITVTVKTESMDDPARVAVTMESVLNRVRSARRQARRGSGPVFSGG